MKIGIIGCGNMGEAIIKGQRAKSREQSLIASDKSKKRRDYIRKRCHISVIKSNIKLAKNSDVVILAIKPQDMEEVLSEIAYCLLPTAYCPLFISIAAGISTSFIESFFKSKVGPVRSNSRIGPRGKQGGVKPQMGTSNGVRVIRVMPNMPALIGEAVSAICKGRYASDKDLNIAKKIFRSLGEMIEIEEKYLNLITALSGSGPAYFFYIVEQLIKAGVSSGLEKKISERLAIQTGLGSLRMLAQGRDAEELRKKVTSKGGTTEAAFRVFQKRKMAQIFAEAIRTAVRKAEELEQ